MSHLLNLHIISLCLFLLSLTSLGQELQTPEGDKKYREDQFYIGVNYNLISAAPDGVSLNGVSGGLHFGFLRDMPFNERRNLSLAIGAGLSVDQFGQNLFVDKDSNGVGVFTILTDDVDFRSNLFSMATIEAPLEFRWRTSTAKSYKFWRIYAGFRVGYTFWNKANLRLPSSSISQSSISEFDKVRLGATLSFGYSTFNFFAYYSLNPLFENTALTADGQEVGFKTIKVGLMFYIL